MSAAFRPNLVDSGLCRASHEQGAVLPLDDGSQVRILRTEEDLPLPFRCHAKELPVNSGGHGQVAVAEEVDGPDVRLLRFEKHGALAALGVDAIDPAIRRGRGIDRAVVERDAVDFRLGCVVDQLQIAAPKAIDLTVVSSAEEPVTIRRSSLRKHKRIAESCQLAQYGAGP